MKKTLIALACVLLSACGGSPHKLLNTLTDLADPTQDLAAATCDAFEWRIVSRGGTTLAEDTEDLAKVRAICDRIFDAFQRLRVLQERARAHLDANEQEQLREVLADIQLVWAEIQNLVPELRSLDI